MFPRFTRSLLARVAPRVPAVILCAAGAMVINFGIAWTAVVFHEPSGAPDRFLRAGGLVWPAATVAPVSGEDAGGEVILLHISSGPAVDWSDAYIERPAVPSGPPLPDIWVEAIPGVTRTTSVTLDGAGVRAGWPFRSVYACTPDATIAPGAPRTALNEATAVLGAWQIPWGPTESRLLPRSILTLGTIANLSLFTATLYILAAGPRAYRSMRWREELRCPVCGYPVQQLVVCPECGAAID